MTRRRLLLLAAFACLLLAGPFVVRWATTPGPGVTPENFKRLHKGMNVAGIQAIIGRPPDRIENFRAAAVHVWTENQWEIAITTSGGTIADGTCKLQDGHLHAWAVLAQAPERLLAKIRRWLGL